MFKELTHKPASFLTYEGLLRKYMSGAEMHEDEILTLLEDSLKINNYMTRYLREYGVTYIYDRDGAVQFALAKYEGE